MPKPKTFDLVALSDALPDKVSAADVLILVIASQYTQSHDLPPLRQEFPEIQIKPLQHRMTHRHT
jgi:hypothetical protein